VSQGKTDFRIGSGKGETVFLRLDELTADMLDEGIREGAVLRVRPKAMTVAVIVAGLLPIFAGSGAGSEVMSRIAGPMVGGMLTAPLLSMLVIPAAYLLIRRRPQ
jgi:Cu(I)/Ag(I) efflux system membrane protein CusA/SilA